MTDEKDDEQDVNEEEKQEETEIAEEIEEETSGGLLSGFSRESVLAGGILLGIAVGLITGYALTAAGPGEAQEVSPAQVQEDLEVIMTGGDEEMADELEIHDPEREHGMYHVTYSAEQVNPETNETESVEQSVFVSIDGELIFPVEPQLGTPIETAEALAMVEQQDQMPGEGAPEDEIPEEELEDLEDEMEDELEDEETTEESETEEDEEETEE